ncbi:MAG: AAA family ATPase [bacterium]|nr:AAA family ATPase [bacterium]
MKFPYGLCDFKKIVTQGYCYCDRTDYIPLLEQGSYQLFLRPRRFGKSLLLSMLANYYDIAKADLFDTLFGHLKIGRQPTLLHHQYFILKWDFSCVDPSGNAQEIKRSLYNHINGCIYDFALSYQTWLPREIPIDSDDALHSIKSLIAVVRQIGHPIYLLIDEYDNFANEVLMGVRQGNAVYEALVFEEGPLKTLFKTIKSSTSDSIFDRIFITGVSPVVLSDLTSGYNIARSLSLDDSFHALCGFLESDIAGMLRRIAEETGLQEDEITRAGMMMRTYYNQHLFAVEATDSIYNPTLALYFLDYVARKRRFPREMLDMNLATDDAKLRYIATIPGGKTLLTDLNQGRHEVMIRKLEDRFGMKQMLSDQSKDRRFLASLLYYFGILTLNGETDEGKLRLTVPNLVMRKLYVDRLQEMLLPNPMERDEAVLAAEQVYTIGTMQPLVDFIEQQYFRIFRNADYKWANELTVKTLFLSLLYNDTLYIMDSEPEVERRYPDVTMIIRPDMRRFKISDVLIEFKYIKLKDIKMTGEQVRKTNLQTLQQIPLMQREMNAARQQATDYGDALQRKYPDLRLKRFAVVAVGFERLWWEVVP